MIQGFVRLVNFVFWSIVAIVAAWAGLMWYLDHKQKQEHPFAYYQDHPTERAKDGYTPTDAELDKELGPKTEVTEDGRWCVSGRCPGGYATKADYLKAHPNN
jgi:hypothetical protein